MDFGDLASSIGETASGAATSLFNTVAHIGGHGKILGGIMSAAAPARASEDPELKVARTIGSFFLGGMLLSHHFVAAAAAGSISGGVTEAAPMAPMPSFAPSAPSFGMN